MVLDSSLILNDFVISEAENHRTTKDAFVIQPRLVASPMSKGAFPGGYSEGHRLCVSNAQLF